MIKSAKPLAAHLDDGFREAQTGVIELTDDDQDTVERLLQYLYHEDYLVYTNISATNLSGSSTPVPKHAQEILTHTTTYIIADKFDLPGLKNLAGK